MEKENQSNPAMMGTIKPKQKKEDVLRKMSNEVRMANTSNMLRKPNDQKFMGFSSYKGGY